MKVLTCTGGAVVGDVLFDCWKQNIVFQMGKNGKNEQNSLPIYRENALPTVIPLSGSNGKGNNRYSFKCDRTVKIISLFSNQLIELRSNWKKTSSDGLFPKSLLLFRIENQEYRHNWSIDIIIVIRYVTSLIVLCERKAFESIGIHLAFVVQYQKNEMTNFWASFNDVKKTCCTNQILSHGINLAWWSTVLSNENKICMCNHYDDYKENITCSNTVSSCKHTCTR